MNLGKSDLSEAAIMKCGNYARRRISGPLARLSQWCPLTTVWWREEMLFSRWSSRTKMEIRKGGSQPGEGEVIVDVIVENFQLLVAQAACILLV